MPIVCTGTDAEKGTDAVLVACFMGRLLTEALFWRACLLPCRALHGYCVKQPTLSSHLRGALFSSQEVLPPLQAAGVQEASGLGAGGLLVGAARDHVGHLGDARVAVESADGRARATRLDLLG